MASEFLTDREKKVLEVDDRRRLYGIVKNYPGIHFREVERKSRLSTGSVQYHLNFLVKQNLIKLEKENNSARYFPKDFLPENKKIMAYLRSKSTKNIILFILTNNDCNHEQIVRFVNLSPSTVSWHLKKLEESDIIRFIKKGRKTFYNILIDKDEIMKLLITYQESFLDTMVDNIVDMWETG